jgi:hypothetical protein
MHERQKGTDDVAAPLAAVVLRVRASPPQAAAFHRDAHGGGARHGAVGRGGQLQKEHAVPLPAYLRDQAVRKEPETVEYLPFPRVGVNVVGRERRQRIYEKLL